MLQDWLRTSVLTHKHRRPSVLQVILWGESLGWRGRSSGCTQAHLAKGMRLASGAPAMGYQHAERIVLDQIVKNLLARFIEMRGVHT
jgi:hypothetical protein